MADGNETGPTRVCPWCSAPVPPDAARCPACGDSLAQRESIDGLAIPGVTIVDPALQADAERPLRIPLTTPSSVDPIGGAINLSGMAELAALAAPFAGAPVDPSTVGQPTEAALQAAERQDRVDAST
jgi:RNA polymerase subunit RPABC4/transcription elongation factor Spt4